MRGPLSAKVRSSSLPALVQLWRVGRPLCCMAEQLSAPLETSASPRAHSLGSSNESSNRGNLLLARLRLLTAGEDGYGYAAMKSYRFFLGGSSGAAADVISSARNAGRKPGKPLLQMRDGRSDEATAVPVARNLTG